MVASINVGRAVLTHNATGVAVPRVGVYDHRKRAILQTRVANCNEALLSNHTLNRADIMLASLPAYEHEHVELM